MYGELKERTVLVTGATGLIGQSLVRRLTGLGAKVIAIIRSMEKAQRLFADTPEIAYILSEITELEIKDYAVDYIIHAASNTSSKAFVEDPVGVAQTALVGTANMLKIAARSHVRGFVYLSSMEVYGMPASDGKIDEDHPSNLNVMKVRSTYPESKRMCENLCAAYGSQYGVPARVVRLTQTFGPGVQYDDGRVFAEFARCAIEGRDIVLHTKGETKRCYLHTEDAVDAILTVMLAGENGEAYNAANEETYCSIYEMAELVAREFGGDRCGVRIEEVDGAAFGYAPTLHMNLDTAKLQSLGWKARYGLADMYSSMIADMRSGNH